MVHYRETIIKQILLSPDALSVESIIDHHLSTLVTNGTHDAFIFRIIDKLKISLNEIKIEKLKEQEHTNVKYALNVLGDYGAKKLNQTKIENQ